MPRIEDDHQIGLTGSENGRGRVVITGIVVADHSNIESTLRRIPTFIGCGINDGIDTGKILAVSRNAIEGQGDIRSTVVRCPGVQIDGRGRFSGVERDGKVWRATEEKGCFGIVVAGITAIFIDGNGKGTFDPVPEHILGGVSDRGNGVGGEKATGIERTDIRRDGRKKICLAIIGKGRGCPAYENLILIGSYHDIVGTVGQYRGFGIVDTGVGGAA